MEEIKSSGEDMSFQDDASNKINSGTNLGLSEIRNYIDQIDRSLAHLLAQRFELACLAGRAKMDLNRPIKDDGREKEVIDNVTSQIEKADIKAAIATVYKTLHEQSRVLQFQIQDNDSNEKSNLEASNYFPKVAIIGLGLIGGSIAYQIKRHIPATEIKACDKIEVINAAISTGLIGSGADKPNEIIQDANLIILAASPNENVKLLPLIAPWLKAGQLVLDVSSTKTQICQIAEAADLQGAEFIGGHPFWGSEKSGWQNSQNLDLKDKTFCLSPTNKTTELNLRRLIKWLMQLDLNVHIVEPDKHDLTVAYSSHLIQILAVTLGDELAKLEFDPMFCGPSFRQLARLMKSPVNMWQEIIGQNNKNIVLVLGNIITSLNELKTDLEKGSGKVLSERFESAQKIDV